MKDFLKDCKPEKEKLKKINMSYYVTLIRGNMLTYQKAH